MAAPVSASTRVTIPSPSQPATLSTATSPMRDAPGLPRRDLARRRERGVEGREEVAAPVLVQPAGALEGRHRLHLDSREEEPHVLVREGAEEVVENANAGRVDDRDVPHPQD